MSGADYRMQQEQDEQASYLLSSLNNLRGYISADLFQRAERELGFFNGKCNLKEGNGNDDSKGLSGNCSSDAPDGTRGH